MSRRDHGPPPQREPTPLWLQAQRTPPQREPTPLWLQAQREEFDNARSKGLGPAVPQCSEYRHVVPANQAYPWPTCVCGHYQLYEHEGEGTIISDLKERP